MSETRCTDPACDQRHCALCRREHTTDAHPNTCPACVGRVRADLAVIDTHGGRLEEEALIHASETPPGAARLSPMGGEPMVMLGPVSCGSAMLSWALATGDYEDLTAADQTGDDPPLLVLATWEDCWRDWWGQPTRDRATLGGAVRYLDGLLTSMAQQAGRVDDTGGVEFAPDFTEFAADVARVRRRLEDVLAEGVRPVRGVACFGCGSDLVQPYTDPRPCPHLPRVARDAAEQARASLIGPLTDATYRQAIREALDAHHCDQGGRRDDWKCSNPACRERYDPDRYKQAKAHAMADVDVNPWRTAGQVEASLGVRPATLRQWVARGEITPVRGPRNGWWLYDVTQVRERAMGGGMLRGA